MTTLDAVPALRGTDPGTGTAVRRPPARTGRARTAWTLSRRAVFRAGTAVGMAALSVFPAARRAYADGYTIYAGCPSYASDHNCSPGCGPSAIFADACNTSGTYTGFHKNDGVTWILRPNECYSGTYDGWLWRFQGACGACACSVERRCHDGYRKTSSGWVRSICRWNTECGCLGKVLWPSVRRSATGVDVYTVQHLLTNRGHLTTVDGIFGADTEAKVKAFQTAAGLAATGVVDATTWPALVVVVRSGNSSHAVRGAQRQLNAHGHGLSVDGVFGPATDAAVRDFQRQNGLTADGIVGENTWRTLTGAPV
ncbi:peptidoglycan-binding protein [Micromonospora echinospora]|uniref:Peptidoglycan-binding (PGRP) domain of peptidoglycan hydrolases-containing protein n=1 Tax=Micromonospora echinospora TaxID=1877 RepID=A0A1C4Z4P8_MICEC|nr:peptidoglycan-binding protein [Micromonospora echinospora]OZV74300.1 peptidoglycan-binding protein [Micromonospora echinospora]SCF27965.1 Peptidoglycan-binding (PGRP) domain of peptidoglycan hydrolases-containing protein [Micromonospora echinospora]